MHLGGAQFLAVERTHPGGELRFQLIRPGGRDQAGGVQRAAKSLRRPAAAEGFQVRQCEGGVAGNLAPGVEHGLRAVQPIRWLPEDSKCVCFHQRLVEGALSSPTLSRTRF